MKRCVQVIIVLIALGSAQVACNLPTLADQELFEPQLPGSTIESAPISTVAPEITPTLINNATATPLAVTWNQIGLPTGAQKTYRILVHPEDENLWFVLGYPGSNYSSSAIFRTTNGGQSWQNVRTGGAIRDIALDPGNTNTLYSTDTGKLIKSINRGITWTAVHDFGDLIESFLISTIDGAIYVLPRWYDDSNPGVYRSMDGGQSWDRFSFGGNLPNFIPWDIEEDPNNGLLYVVIEIGDHPQPYDPPFYRSLDRGATWEEIGDELNWHGLSIQVDPLTSDVYYLTEGDGLYKSSDLGLHWVRVSPEHRFASDLLLDPAGPPRLIGTDLLHLPTYQGGVYYSDDGGESFVFLGMDGHMTASITLNSSSTVLYVVSFEQGIFTAEIPAP